MASAVKKLSKKRQNLSINRKIAILNAYERGMRASHIARKFNINESTVRTVKKHEARIRECARTISSDLAAKKGVHIRNPMIHKLENLLFMWVTEQIERDIILDASVLLIKAQSIYADLVSKNGEGSKATSFTAGRGWLAKFKKRFNLSVRNGNYVVSRDTRESSPQIKEETVDANNMSITVQSGLVKKCGSKSKSPNCTKKPSSVNEFIQTANRLKELVGKIEMDRDRIESFKRVVDGTMFCYNEKLIKECL